MLLHLHLFPFFWGWEEAEGHCTITLAYFSYFFPRFISFQVQGHQNLTQQSAGLQYFERSLQKTSVIKASKT